MKIVPALLPVGCAARMGTALDGVLALVVHWPSVPNQRAMDVRNYWAGLDNKGGASAHAVIDLDGIIYQTLPWYELAAAVGSDQVDPASGRVYTDQAREAFGKYAANPLHTSPNRVSISVELCHIDATGTMTNGTLASAVELFAWLAKKYSLDPRTRILRHWDVVGWKKCPLWFVDHTNDFITFRENVAKAMEGA